MLKSPLFFHQQTPRGRSLGFSCLFTPADKPTDDQGHLVVNMTFTRCNRNDKAFNKKLARVYLRERTPELVRVKDIPRKLGELHHIAYFGFDAEPYKGEGIQYQGYMKRFI